jgi:beta-lactamase superfamily II metal-dependent hydrolase
MFRIDMLPAQRGDALWLTYGDPEKPRHVLVDAGPSETIPTLVPSLERNLGELGRGANRVELLAISHIDADHIQGVVSLLSGPARVKLFRDVWFNGFEHLRPDTLGAEEGEQLTRLLSEERTRWNRAFKGDAVVVADDGELPTKRLAGGLELTLLSPTAAGLSRLVPKWKRECEKAGLIEGKGAEVPRAWRRDEFLGFDVDTLASMPYTRDRAEANGSSIAFIARYEGASVLCAADAHSEVMEASLDRLSPKPHRFTAVKVSHHGSRANLSPGFLERVRSRNWLISTNGAKFGHPSPQALARIVTTQQKPVFHLNYVTEHVEDLIKGAGERYTVKLPRRRRDGRHEEGITVPLG